MKNLFKRVFFLFISSLKIISSLQKFHLLNWVSLAPLFYPPYFSSFLWIQRGSDKPAINIYLIWRMRPRTIIISTQRKSRKFLFFLCRKKIWEISWSLPFFFIYPAFYPCFPLMRLLDIESKSIEALRAIYHVAIINLA